MIVRTVLQILMALLAIYGLYCLLDTVAKYLAGRDRIFLAVELRDERDAEHIESLLCEALMRTAFRCAPRIAVLIPERLSRDERIALAVKRYGGECLVYREEEDQKKGG